MKRSVSVQNEILLEDWLDLVVVAVVVVVL